MSSFQLRAIREIPKDPFAKFANELSKKLSRFLTKDQLDLLDDREDIYTDGQDFDSVVRLHSDLLSTKTFNFATQFYPPTEPDRNKLVLWFTGKNSSSTRMSDRSTFGSTIIAQGDPLLIDGTPFDYGLHTAGVKSLALRFNRPTSEFVNGEYVKASTPNDGADVEGIATGISYFIRFRPKSLTEQGGVTLRLFEKTDDATPNNGVMVQLSDTGRIMAQVVRSGTTTTRQTPTSTIAVDTVYDVWITYNVTGNAIKIYVNNVDQTLTTPSALNWHTNMTDAEAHSLYVFRRGPGTGLTYMYADLYDYRIYREKVVSTTEVGRFHTNKWTIADIPFGQVMIANYWSAYDEAGTESFTSTSFTTTSFT